jgi:hypothetical protein
MYFRRSLAATLLIIVMSQTILLGGGLLGACAEAASRICHCNHGSKKEIHSHKEDSLFKNELKTKKLVVSTQDKTQTKLNCHTAEAGVAHMCSCKKKKSSLARLSIYYQTWISDFSFSSLRIFITDEFFKPSSFDLVQDEWNWKIIKPPRTT